MVSRDRTSQPASYNKSLARDENVKNSSIVLNGNILASHDQDMDYQAPHKRLLVEASISASLSKARYHSKDHPCGSQDKYCSLAREGGHDPCDHMTIHIDK
jgi:hypothetical protein